MNSEQYHPNIDDRGKEPMIIPELDEYIQKLGLTWSIKYKIVDTDTPG